jgi:hypothetical protein
MFYLWRQMDDNDRRRVWRLYGWYSALMVCGSCFGAVTWAARMINLAEFFKGNSIPNSYSNQTDAEKYSFQALSRKWRAVFVVAYAIEFLCLSAAKLMVLDRMSDFAASQRWAAWARAVMAAVVLGNVVGVSANLAAAAHFHKVSEAFSTASAYYAENNTEAGRTIILSVAQDAQLAASIAAVQSFCEVAVLLLIVAAFVAVGVLCARRVRSVLLAVDADSAAAAAGRTLRMQVLGTTGFVFAAFLLRSVVSTMLAVANQFQDFGNSLCFGRSGTDTCVCYNVYTLMTHWSNYSPAFQPTVVLISSPLALLVALWGMTSKPMLQFMKTGQRGTIILSTPLRRGGLTS